MYRALYILFFFLFLFFPPYDREEVVVLEVQVYVTLHDVTFCQELGDVRVRGSKFQQSTVSLRE